MGFYEKQFGGLDNKKEKPEEEPKPEPASFFYFVRKNIGRLFLWNLLLALCCIPSGVLFYFYFLARGLAFLIPALLCLLLAGPAWVCVNHLSFLIVRKVPRYQFPSFRSFYRSNRKQGIEAAAVSSSLALLIFFWLDTMSGYQGSVPVSIWCFFLVAAILAIAYVTFCFAQISLFPLPFPAILKNSLILIFACGWRGLLSALIQLVFIAVNVMYYTYTFPCLLILGPALVNCVSCRLIWPKLDRLIFTGNDRNLP